MADLLANLSYWQLIGIGCALGALCLVIFRWRTIRKIYQEEKSKTQIGAKRHQPIVPTAVTHTALPEKMAAGIERAVCAMYRGWCWLPVIIRAVVCLPLGIALVGAFFFATIWPSFLGALSFGVSKVVLQELNIIPIFTMHMFIYLLLPRGRFILSTLLALGILIFSIIIFVGLPHGADIWDVTCRGIYQCIAAFCVAWAWVKSHANRPAAMFHLMSGLLIASGIVNVILSVLMLVWVPSVAGGATDQVLTLPLYNSFMPLLTQLLSPLHLDAGDFTSANITLAIIIMAWGGLLFCLGGFLCLAKYNAIAAMPKGVERITIYT